ncbi:uncharacterized protein LOC109136586 isoform X1 [Larimichthys crocea]|uniref:uncharacterized protein LOC109136586 isoform X1 n=1 Tax=Larimichthys crocea TaxID=215358 RepID=UPI000F5FDA12|nr:uncharacterized protein LOC109136586 isoform X1 [Larimichthys crocea]XP_027138897.1 uncharacterized protein LOC109136586 isoform X1 [Larimichthys crocea]
MCSAVDSAEIIILSDDDEDISCSEASVLFVEDVNKKKKKNDCPLPPTALDEDLVVTFSHRAEVLPHARYDCPIHPFTATDCEIGGAVASNQLICDQCFCYICDKLASSCVLWCHSGVSHCNSHKRSDFWNNLRNSLLLGRLKAFNLTLSEIDAHLRHAETMLQNLRQELAAQFSFFQKGKMVEEYGLSIPGQQGLIYDYTPVYELVSSFLNKADKQGGRAAAIMRLGAAEDFIRHFQVAGAFIIKSPTANAAEAKVVLLQRVISSLQRQMVMDDFTPEFARKLQDFYKKLYFPTEVKSLRNSLCVRPWDDVLLVSVLKGQNVMGVRKDKGKKDVLIEQISIVSLRTEALQRQHRYRELCRYLRVIRSDDSKLLQQLRDLIPMFMCMAADFTSALVTLFPPVNPPASRFTPHVFHFYLCIFTTATAPKMVASHSAQLYYSDTTWEPINGAVPLKRDGLVKFALRVQRCCPAVFTDSQCWTSLLTIVNAPHGSVTALPAPSPQFLHEAKDVVNLIVLDQQWTNIQIPRNFQAVYPDQALLLLVTGALSLRILNSALSPALPVLNTFKDNAWALQWLWDSLSSSAERLSSFLQELTQEMTNMSDGDSLLPSLRALVPTQSSETENWDQKSGGS